MLHNYFKKLLFCSILFCLSLSSQAWWGTTGHRVVGEIAETYLTPKAKQSVAAILGNESIAIASTWADFIRSDSSYNYLTAWHYVNVKGGLDYAGFKSALEKDTTTDAYTKLNFLVKELKNKQLAADKKLLYLRMLIHIVGDIHQPMHVSHAEDAGGNKVRVMWFNESTNLHSVWDEKLVDNQKLSYTEFSNAINHTTAKQRADWQREPMIDWFYQSYQISEKLYGEITQADQKLSYRYNFDHIETVNQQLLKAGVRLAGLLNEIFK